MSLMSDGGRPLSLRRDIFPNLTFYGLYEGDMYVPQWYLPYPVMIGLRKTQQFYCLLYSLLYTLHCLSQISLPIYLNASFVNLKYCILFHECVYYTCFLQGLSHALRKQAWKFLLGYFPWDSTKEERTKLQKQKT